MPGDAGVGAAQWMLVHSWESPVVPIPVAAGPPPRLHSLQESALSKSNFLAGVLSFLWQGPVLGSLGSPWLLLQIRNPPAAGDPSPGGEVGPEIRARWVMRGRVHTHGPEHSASPDSEPWHSSVGRMQSLPIFLVARSGLREQSSRQTHASQRYTAVSGTWLLEQGQACHPLGWAESSGPGVLAGEAGPPGA